MILICMDCGSILTEEELHYYETRCEACERLDLERVENWRCGANDPELDELFDFFPEKKKH